MTHVGALQSSEVSFDVSGSGAALSSVGSTDCDTLAPGASCSVALAFLAGVTGTTAGTYAASFEAHAGDAQPQVQVTGEARYRAVGYHADCSPKGGAHTT